jgi:hypothetical protein
MSNVKNESSSQIWNFISEPDLHPMKIMVKTNKLKKSEGFIFVAPYVIYGNTMVGQTGCIIMNQEGTPIWFSPLSSPYIQNTDFKVQKYKGKLVLTLWEGTISGTQSTNPNLPDGDPEPGAFFKIIDQNYKLVKKIYAHNGFTSDVHEFIITKRNTALFLGLKQVEANLAAYGGPEDGYIDNYSIQEVCISTNKLIFFWNALDHVNPNDSMVAASTTTNNIWDCFHVNSLEENPCNENQLLVSMRNMWTIYCIDKITGNILWQLGGKRNEFTFENDAMFSWQHYARFHSNNKISLFDDACCASTSSPSQGQSRGLILELDFERKMANKYKTFYHDPPLFAASQGNAQRLLSSNYFIGWGQEPKASEFLCCGNTASDPSKNLIYEIEYPNDNISYRTFKYDEWIGKPLYPPSITIITKNEYINVYVSWNGSTETVAWKLFAGKHKEKLHLIKDMRRTGFETKIQICDKGPYYQVYAIDHKKNIIGVSEILKNNKCIT